MVDDLGRYTHRVALSNERLPDVKDGQVTFQWKDYRVKGREKSRVMTLESDEFIRRFLIHVLPRGFQRIRFFGTLSNRNRKVTLATCRRLLAGPMASNPLYGVRAGSAARSWQLPDPAPAGRPGIDPALPPD